MEEMVNEGELLQPFCHDHPSLEEGGREGGGGKEGRRGGRRRRRKRRRRSISTGSNIAMQNTTVILNGDDDSELLLDPSSTMGRGEQLYAAELNASGISNGDESFLDSRRTAVSS